ncbi:hypothetical protein CMV_005682 [Castanea mollissima]|uniref:Uncharacterized protein n=1 Tax=Castanea mollissima TaxID=60419 RepID=A0A8J4W450_9ROSI|nr:hypothetical protein CMV_005682 [Castanea mollissima]
MKAILVVCFLLLSTFFIPSSNAARELAVAVVPVVKPGATASCGRGKPYTACKPQPQPPPKPKADPPCNVYRRRGCSQP